MVGGRHLERIVWAVVGAAAQGLFCSGVLCIGVRREHRGRGRGKGKQKALEQSRGWKRSELPKGGHCCV